MSISSNRIRVLHVDDESEFTDLTARYLERRDDRFTVVTATGASEGLEYLADEGVDCIVSDYEMPEMNGIEFLERVREIDPDLPFILFTGKGSEEVASHAISTGVTDYLQKQRGAEQYDLLATRIDTAVGQYRAERELERKNDLFRKVQTLADIGAWEWYPDDRTGYFSEKVLEIYGVDSRPDPSPEADIEEFYHPDDRDQMRNAFETAIETGRPYDVEVRVLAADGTEKWVRTSGDPQFEDGECVRIRGTIQDITDRKERERELESEREFIEQSLNTLNDIFYLVDTEGDFQRWNETLPELTGYTDEEIDSMNALDFFEGEHRESIEAAIRDILQTGSNVTEAEITTKDGRQVPHEFRGVRMTDETGETTGIIGIARDITERKKRERDLQRFKYFVEYSPELIVVLNEDMTVQYQSPESPALEVDPNRITGENPLEFIHDDDVPRVVEDFQRVIEDPAVIARTEYRAKDADGNWQWFENRTQNCLDIDPINGLLVTVREETDRKEAERELAEYGETLETMQEATQTLLSAADRREAAEFVIDGLEDALQYDLAGLWLLDDDEDTLEPVAVTAAGADLFDAPPAYSTEDESLSWDAFQTGTTRRIDDLGNHEERYNAETPIGSELIVPLGEHGVLNVGSTDTGSFTDRDVLLVELWADTASVILDRLERERQLKQRERELMAERDRLDQFASVVSHDLRNPLNVARGRLELLSEDCDSEHLPALERAHQRMERLIEDLLTLAREGEAVVETEPVRIADLVEGCWDTVDTSDATLVVDLDRDWIVHADQSRLKQVFENLFRNAIEHGGHDVTVTIGTTEAGFYLEDDGPGIPDDERDNVFEAGYSTARENTGFGLSIVKQVIDAHDWEIRITDSSAGGARFEILVDDAELP